MKEQSRVHLGVRLEPRFSKVNEHDLHLIISACKVLLLLISGLQKCLHY